MLPVLTAIFPIGASADRIIEIRKKNNLNPTIYFAGVSGNAELSAALRTFLGVCGWFDLADKAAGADYTLTAEYSGKNLTLHLKQGTTPLGAWRFAAAAAPREVAKSAVDTVIERAFAQLKVRSFCRSRIAFAATFPL